MLIRQLVLACPRKASPALGEETGGKGNGEGGRGEGWGRRKGRELEEMGTEKERERWGRGEGREMGQVGEERDGGDGKVSGNGKEGEER